VVVFPEPGRPRDQDHAVGLVNRGAELFSRLHSSKPSCVIELQRFLVEDAEAAFRRDRRERRDAEVDFAGVIPT